MEISFCWIMLSIEHLLSSKRGSTAAAQSHSPPQSSGMSNLSSYPSSCDVRELLAPLLWHKDQAFVLICRKSSNKLLVLFQMGGGCCKPFPSKPSTAHISSHPYTCILAGDINTALDQTHPESYHKLLFLEAQCTLSFSDIPFLTGSCKLISLF